MALAPGGKFAYGDLAQLVARANSLTSQTWDLSGFYDVAPMYNDPSGNKWGHREMAVTAINAVGSGYLVGDTVSLGYSSEFLVEAVTAAGGVLGLRPVALGVGQYSDPASFTNTAVTGGTGSGCHLSATFSQVGPEKTYSMPDFSTLAPNGVQNAGTVLSLLLNSGGTGYAVNDMVTVTDLGTVVTVNSVSAGGVVATFTVTTAGNLNTFLAVPNDVLSMATTTSGSGVGATFSGLFLLPQRPTWLTELNRMRRNAEAIPNFMAKFSPAELCVSSNQGNGWPVSGPTADFTDTWFWFAGNAATVTVSSILPQSLGKFTTAVGTMTLEDDTGTSPNGTFYNGTYVKTFTVSLVVGGTQNLTGITGTFYVMLPVYVGYTYTTYTQSSPPPATVTDMSDPAALVTVQANTFPAAFSLQTVTNGLGPVVPGWGQVFVCAYCTLPGSMAPGRYDVTFSMTIPTDDEHVYNPDPYVAGLVSFVAIAHTKVDMTGNNQSGVNAFGGYSAYFNSQRASTFFFTSDPYGSSFKVLNVSGSVTGSISFSTAVPAPGIHGSMAVNKIQLPGDVLGNGPGFCAVYENMVGPPVADTWGANTNYSSGAKIVDRNGNTQQADNAGVSGGVEPGSYGADLSGSGAPPSNPNSYGSPSPPYIAPVGWATGVGGTTVDGTITWTCTAVNSVVAPDYTAYPYAQPVFQERVYPANVSISTSVPGFWTAFCQPVSSLNLATQEDMPWNLRRTKYYEFGSPQSINTIMVNPMLYGDLSPNVVSNTPTVSGSYDQALACEKQIEPPSWAANTYFPANFTIIDSNGNTQKVGVAGTSGATAPGWAATEGAHTTDGTGLPIPLTWNCIYVFKLPDTWQASTGYLATNTIVDSNGNVQTAQNPGTSGGSAPVWNKNLNGTTTDGGVTWKMTYGARTINPGQHRLVDIPRYPFYWFSETNARLKPPLNTGSALTFWGSPGQWWPVNESDPTQSPPTYDQGWSQLYPSPDANDPPEDTRYTKGGMAHGWWIYSVSLNRMQQTVKLPPSSQSNIIGAGDAGNPSGVGAGGGDSPTGASAGTQAKPQGSPAGEVAVTIGCMRSGVFVPFGTWLTGQTIQVLWPVFTSDALVYQCSERVDIQAVAIATGNSVSQGAAVASPLCAAYVLDTLALLNLIT